MTPALELREVRKAFGRTEVLHGDIAGTTIRCRHC